MSKHIVVPSVRSATREDCAQLLELGRLRPMWREGPVCTALASREMSLLLVVADGVAVGALWANISGQFFDVYDVVVAAKERRRGYARAGLRALQHVAMAKGVAGISLEVAADNAAGLALYRGLGFVDVSVRPDYYRRPGKSVAALVLQWLCPSDPP